jgi:hypothetical protein
MGSGAGGIHSIAKINQELETRSADASRAPLSSMGTIGDGCGRIVGCAES